MPNREELIARALQLVPALKERAAACEELGRLPDDTVADLKRAGLANVCKPKLYGGGEMGFDTLCEIIMTLARGCGSTAWVTAVYAEHNLTLGNSSRQLLDELWGEDQSVFISSGNDPQAAITPVEGGFRFTGQLRFSSGCDHVGWFMTPGRIDGSQERYGCTLPRSEATILDTWDVYGLRGTGSKDVKFENAFVPYHRLRASPHSPPPNGGTEAEAENVAIYRLSQATVKPYSLASVAVGLAGAMIEEFTDEMKSRASRFGAKIAEFQSLQLRIAESAAEHHAARLVILSNIRETQELLETEPEAPLEMSLRNWRDMGFACRLALQSIDRLFYAAGANGLFLSNRLQRHFRDAHAACGQFRLAWDVSATQYGRVKLGLEPQNFRELYL